MNLNIVYLIRSKLNGFVLDITGSNTAPAQIISYPTNGEKGTSNQQWHFVPAGNGAYLIKSVLNDFILDITGNNAAPVTPIISYPTNGTHGTSNQQWELVPVAGTQNTYLIRSKLNGFVLDVEGSNHAASTRIISYPVNNQTGTPNQHWELVPVATLPINLNTEYLIRSKLNGFVLDITGSNTAPATQVISYPVNGEKGTSNQQWHFVPAGNGTYLIKSALNDFVVDITGSNTAPVTPIISYPTNGAQGTSNQQWELVPVPNVENAYLIRSKLNGFVLDIEGSNTAACTRVISYPINNQTGTPNQQWELVPVATRPVNLHAEYLIRSRLNGFVLDITGSNKAAATQIISYPVNGEKGTSNQQWHFAPAGNGSYLIKSALNEFVIDITGSNTAPVTPVISYPTNGQTGTPNQQWELVSVSGTENAYLIRSKLNGFVLDIEGNNRAARARIVSYPANGQTGTFNQQWELVPVATR